jgi:hypothetical protein
MAAQSHLQASATRPGSESYSQRANPVFETELALRKAAKGGAFFLSFLRPGMQM